jgi:DNA-binding MarR family transcriptional regulator
MDEFTAITSRPIEKWGEAAVAGWQALPDLLLKHQSKLELTATELVVLINLLSYWWYVDELPFPRVTTLAKRMNVTPRTVQRAIQRLTELGLLKKVTDHKDGRERDVLDPAGLVQKLKEFARQEPRVQAKQLEMMEAALGEAHAAFQ